MANRSIGAERRIDRRSVLQTGTALAAAGPALLRAGRTQAQP
jgi:hypothetical protein